MEPAVAPCAAMGPAGATVVGATTAGAATPGAATPVAGAPAPGVDADMDLGRAITVLARAYRAAAMSSIGDLPGGPRGYLVLDALAHGRPPSQLALAQQLGVDRTAMTYLLDELEHAGLVERRADPADRRARQVVLTEQGGASLTRASVLVAAAEQQLLAPLDDDETRTFRSLMHRVAAATGVTGPDCE